MWRVYTYYRCVKYKAARHPPVRLTEAKLDEQFVKLFDQMKVDEDVASMISCLLKSWVTDGQKGNEKQAKDITQQLEAASQPAGQPHDDEDGH